tara:strand:- start:1300 stop:1491 length:192 start_codon:yes stop_codon:yes gene_type:complete
MLVKSPLPDTSFTSMNVTAGDSHGHASGSHPVFCKKRFDAAPPQGIILITPWQFPDYVKMIWK